VRMIRFSIVTISYNAEDVIRKTLESVLNQSFKYFEYILVDGASKDKTSQVIEQYISKFNKRGIVIKFISEPDKGIADAFNKGVVQAEGEIVSIINAGDSLLEEALSKVDQLMKIETDVLYGNIIWTNISTKSKYIRKSKENLENLMYSMDVMHPATFVRRSVYDKVGLFDISFKCAMDQEILVRMQKQGARFLCVDDVFVEMEAGGVSDTHPWKGLTEASRIPRIYGAPEIKIFLFKMVKYGKNRLSHLYRFIKKGNVE